MLIVFTRPAALPRVEEKVGKPVVRFDGVGLKSQCLLQRRRRRNQSVSRMLQPAQLTPVRADARRQPNGLLSERGSVIELRAICKGFRNLVKLMRVMRRMEDRSRGGGFGFGNCTRLQQAPKLS